ncbi:MAG: hypothetical protein IT548_18465 [Alphaproteobacteria bacterium]|nr:hypothetical protein [Alphaproteobacteria bacterium]
MTDTVIVKEISLTEGHRFRWGVVIAGGIAAAAVMFFLLTLGAGFGLMLVNPVTEEAPSMPVFLGIGAIYFFAAQAFSFAVGGHLVGRYLGPVQARDAEENFRVASHGFMAWAIAVLASVLLVAFAGLWAGGAGATTAALYGAAAAEKDDTAAGNYLVDRLFRPADAAATPAGAGTEAARAEAGTIIMTALPKGRLVDAADHERLVQVTARQTGLSVEAATSRVDTMNADVKQTADIARKTAAYTSLWIAVSLLFGAMTAAGAALFARYEKDHTLLGRRLVRMA